MFKRTVIKTVTRYPWFGIWLSLVVLAAGLAGAIRVQIMPDLRVFFSDDNPDKIRLEQFETEFVRENTAVIALTAKTGDVFGREPMKAVADVVDAAWKLPYVRRVDSVTNFLYSRNVDGTLVSGPLLPDPRKASALDRARARAVALSHPEIVGGLINQTADVTGVRILFFMPDENARKQTPALLKQLEALRDHIQGTYPNVEARISGSIPLDATLSEAVINDITGLIPAAIIISLIVAGLSLRMAAASGLILLMSGVSAIVAVGTLGWASIPLNIANIMAPIVVMTLSVSYASHLFSSIRREMILEGVADADRTTREGWVTRTLDRHFLPLNMALFTTIVGFLALNFSISPPFQQLGNAVGAGLAATQIMTLTLLPSLVILLPFKGRLQKSPLQHLIEKIPGVLFRRPRTALACSLLAVAGISAGIFNLRIEDNFVGYFDQSFTFRRDADYIDRHLTGMHVLEYPLHASAPGGVYEPDFLAQVEKFTDWARKQPHVAMVQTPTDMLKRVVKNMNDDAPEAYRLPATREEAAQYMMMLEMSLGYGMDLSDSITPDKSAMRVSIALSDVNTTQIRDMERAAEAWINQNTSLLQAEPTGLTHVFTLIAYRDSKAMLLGTAVSLALISLCMMFTLRNFRLGLISLAPNILPICCAFGAWGYGRGDVTLAITVVTSLTFGIIEDDTMHFLAEYKHLREKGMALKAAVTEAFIGCGGGMITTGLALVCGFGVTSLSAFAINRDMSALTMLTLAFGMACEILLTPLLLLTIPHLNGDRRPSENEDVAPHLVATNVSAFAQKEGISA